MAIEASQKLPCFSPSSPVFVTRPSLWLGARRKMMTTVIQLKLSRQEPVNKKPRFHHLGKSLRLVGQTCFSFKLAKRSLRPWFSLETFSLILAREEMMYLSRPSGVTICGSRLGCSHLRQQHQVSEISSEDEVSTNGNVSKLPASYDKDRSSFQIKVKLWCWFHKEGSWTKH